MRDLVPGSDADLLRRTGTGDRDAFALLYRRHHVVVFRFARLMTGSTAMAEDVVQDVFLSLMRDPGRYDDARGSLTSYLYGAARYCTRRRLARERRLVALDAVAARPDDGSPSADVCGELVRRDEILQLRRAVLSLPSRYREVVVLCDLQDVSYGDAAATIGCPLGTVRSRLHRARHLLAVKLRRSDGSARAAALRCAV